MHVFSHNKKLKSENIKLKKGMDEALENIENLIDKVDNL